jgi:hypothetical protein
MSITQRAPFGSGPFACKARCQRWNASSYSRPERGCPSQSYCFSCSPIVVKEALSDKIGTDCTRLQFDAIRRNSERASVHQRAPLAERGQASLFVDFAGDEMTLLVEMVVDLSLN